MGTPLFDLECLRNGTRQTRYYTTRNWYDLFNYAIATDLHQPSRSFQLFCP